MLPAQAQRGAVRRPRSGPAIAAAPAAAAFAAAAAASAAAVELEVTVAVARVAWAEEGEPVRLALVEPAPGMFGDAEPATSLVRRIRLLDLDAAEKPPADEAGDAVRNAAPCIPPN